MSLNDRYCRQCGERFTPSRDDQWFHAPKCVAAFYRDNPNPEYIHAPNYGENWHTCEWCGVDYYVNDYAERGGKRKPKYHSVACKQAAYRARQKEQQQQAARRSTADNGSAPKQNSHKRGENVGNASKDQGKDQQRQQRQQQAPPPPSGSASSASSSAPKWKYVGSSRYDAKAVTEALTILGLTQQVSQAELRKAYRAKIAEWHPDRNSSPHATTWAQAINWAYDYLKH